MECGEKPDEYQLEWYQNSHHDCMEQHQESYNFLCIRSSQYGHKRLEHTEIYHDLCLQQHHEILRHKIMHQWMVDGVDIPCTDGVMIADTVQIGTGTTILPGTILLGNTTIGKDCLIGPNTYIMDGTVGNGVTLDNVKLTDSTVEDGADAGPFVQIRGGSVLHTGVHIGDFVEVKNSTVGAGTKSAHLTYIGDSDVGAGVNFEIF